MNKMLCLYSSLVAVLIVGTANAQLPANPWDTNSFEQVATSKQEQGGVAKISASVDVSENYISSAKYAPVNAEAQAPEYVPAIDSQGNAKTGVTVKKLSDTATAQATQGAKTSGTSVALQQDIQNNGTDWRGSGQFGKLNYVGEVTTYGDAVGQEMLAPEVNQHNLKVMLDHLRNLGYKIPESYNNKYSNFLSDYKNELQRAYNGVGHQNNPFDTMFSGMLDVFESSTGLDIENLLFNSINLLSQD